MSFKKQELLTLCEHLSSPPVRVAHLFSFLCFPIMFLYVLGSVLRTPLRIRTVHLYLQLFVGGLMSYLRYLCFFAYSCVQNMLCCGFFVFFCLHLVSCVLNVAISLDCPFLITPLVSLVKEDVDWFRLLGFAVGH